MSTLLEALQSASTDTWRLRWTPDSYRGLGSPHERFARLYEPDLNSGCWLWTRGLTERGYGAYQIYGLKMRAHRFSYALHHGPIPLGALVCHRCDTPSCVNPAHLFLGSLSDNTQDMLAKGRKPDVRGERHPLRKLNDEAVRAIRAASGDIDRLAAKYGVSRWTVLDVRTGRRWQHVEAA